MKRDNKIAIFTAILAVSIFCVMLMPVQAQIPLYEGVADLPDTLDEALKYFIKGNVTIHMENSEYNLVLNDTPIHFKTEELDVQCKIFISQDEQALQAILYIETYNTEFSISDDDESIASTIEYLDINLNVYFSENKIEYEVMKGVNIPLGLSILSEVVM